jgi:hypothetical protein
MISFFEDRSGWRGESFAVLTDRHRNPMKWYLYDFMWYSKKNPTVCGTSLAGRVFWAKNGTLLFLYRLFNLD